VKRITLYTKAGCTTCIKARQFLLSQGVAYTERDMFKHPLDALELQAIIAQQPVEELFSARSPSAKALGVAPGSTPEAELLEHMLREPRLIRRPLLVAGDRVVVGFDPKALQEVLDA
jgi:Spx/MgsR family transcriptional regulator